MMSYAVFGAAISIAASTRVALRETYSPDVYMTYMHDPGGANFPSLAAQPENRLNRNDYCSEVSHFIRVAMLDSLSALNRMSVL